MNSFELESNTKATPRFDNANLSPRKDISLVIETLENLVPYLTKLRNYDRHIGFYAKHRELKLILENVLDPVGYVEQVDSKGYHTGFFTGKKSLGCF